MNWRTTAFGVVACLVEGAAFFGYIPPELAHAISTGLIGGGLYHARDAKTPETIIEKTTEIKTQ